MRKIAASVFGWQKHAWFCFKSNPFQFDKRIGTQRYIPPLENFVRNATKCIGDAGGMESLCFRLCENIQMRNNTFGKDKEKYEYITI